MSTSVFGDAYACLYSLLYRDKEYIEEANYVLQLIAQAGGSPKSVLDLGCGTGRHMAAFAKAGRTVAGVDRSKSMIEVARRTLRAELALDPSAPLPALESGDIRTVRLSQCFDAVVSLFHVFSYLVADEALEQALETARAHLAPGGWLLFDYWNGPAVLFAKPSVSVRRVEDAKTSVLRVGEPSIHSADNIVEMRFTAMIQDKASQVSEQLVETHTMRYYFQPEIRQALRRAGFAPTLFRAWRTQREPGLDDWGACCLARLEGPANS